MLEAYLPAMQFAHADELVMPVLAWYFPEAHAEHVLNPDPDWYVPASQALQSL